MAFIDILAKQIINIKIDIANPSSPITQKNNKNIKLDIQVYGKNEEKTDK
jgi:hypothetical protein